MCSPFVPGALESLRLEPELFDNHRSGGIGIPFHYIPDCLLNIRDGATGGAGGAAAPPTLNTGALFQPAGQGMDGMLSGCAERSLLGSAVEMTSGVGNQAKGTFSSCRRQDKTYGLWPMFFFKMGPI